MYTSPIRLIAVDLDGTVLNDRKQLTPRTAAALTEAAARGVEIVPATGRTAAGLPVELLALPGVHYAITSNGARMMDLASGRAVRELYLARETALAAFDILARYDCVTDLFQDGRGYTTEANRAAEVAALGVDVVSSLPLNMEINAAGVDKGAGLLALAEQLGLPASALMACGDGGNDTAMVAAAGLGVAMANAFPEVKAAARYVTASNNEDGVARAVETFVLGKEAL